MKIDLFSIDDFVKENNVLEVNDPIFFDSSGNPKDNGLFSYRIFGLNDNERSNNDKCNVWCDRYPGMVVLLL